MNQLLNKLERKLGKYSIHNLMNYLIGLYVIGFIIYTVNPLFYMQYLSLDPAAILRGQIWRIITFVALPPSGSVLMCAILLYVYYMLGKQLEAALGTFRFNLFIFQGIFLHVIASLLLYIVTGGTWRIGMDTQYLILSMFFLFAFMFQDAQFLLYFAIPIKGKWMAWIDAAYFAYAIVQFFLPGQGSASMALAAAVSLLNVWLFFLWTRNSSPYTYKERKRKKEYQQKVHRSSRPLNYYENGARHKCAVCGRTELDNPNLEFRYCSKCNGNYEYCQDHLFTHTHVK